MTISRHRCSKLLVTLPLALCVLFANCPQNLPLLLINSVTTVVYFDQRLGAAHSKRWSKSSFSIWGRNCSLLTLHPLSLFIWEKQRETGEFQIEVLNLYHKHMENRLGKLEVLFTHSLRIPLHLSDQTLVGILYILSHLSKPTKFKNFVRRQLARTR